MAEPKKFEEMGFSEKRKIIEALSVYPALTVMVFLRRKIGYRMVKHEWLGAMTLIMMGTAAFLPSASQPFRLLMVVYALAMFGWGTWQRQLRWKEICQGERWHTYSGGVSYLEKLPLPPILRIYRRTYRWLDPLACMLVGLVVMFLSSGLGGWIFISGIALFIYENALYERMLAHDLDTLDGLVESEVRAETVKFFETPQAEQAQRTLDETSGIPTGVAPDIHAQVEKRKAKQAAIEAATAAAPPQQEGAVNTSAPNSGAPGRPSAAPDNLAAD